MSTATVQGEPRVLLRNISWATFKSLASESQRGARFTYDRGWLEIMSPSPEHERIKTLLARLLELMAYELGIPMRGAGSTTLLNDLAERGLEPDECYYIANEPQVRGKDDIDLAIDPPPDLAIEIDISSSSINQLPIYASLGVPEVWLCRGTAIGVYALQPDGSYVRRERSVAFPFLPLDGLQRFLDRRDSLDENSLLREFVDWLRTLERGAT